MVFEISLPLHMVLSNKLEHLYSLGTVWHHHAMNTSPTPDLYKRHRFPAEIISHCVWLYYRFSLSDRDVEELMAERGVTLSHEAVRYWCRKFGQAYAKRYGADGPALGTNGILMKSF